MDEIAGFAADIGVLRSHAASVRAIGEHQWAELAARLRVLAVADEAFGDAAALAQLPEAYTAVREDLADRAGHTAHALVAAADTLEVLAARYQATADEVSRSSDAGR